MQKYFIRGVEGSTEARDLFDFRSLTHDQEGAGQKLLPGVRVLKWKTLPLSDYNVAVRGMNACCSHAPSGYDDRGCMIRASNGLEHIERD